MLGDRLADDRDRTAVRARGASTRSIMLVVRRSTEGSTATRRGCRPALTVGGSARRREARRTRRPTTAARAAGRRRRRRRQRRLRAGSLGAGWCAAGRRQTGVAVRQATASGTGAVRQRRRLAERGVARRRQRARPTSAQRCSSRRVGSAGCPAARADRRSRGVGPSIVAMRRLDAGGWRASLDARRRRGAAATCVLLGWRGLRRLRSSSSLTRLITSCGSNGLASTPSQPRFGALGLVDRLERAGQQHDRNVRERAASA